MWLVDYLTNRIGIVQFQSKKSKVNHLITGTPQGSSLSSTLFTLVINQLLQLNLGSKLQMITCADDLTIHGGPIRGDTLNKQMTTALKKIETKAIDAIRLQDSWIRDILVSISQIPRVIIDKILQ